MVRTSDGIASTTGLLVPAVAAGACVAAGASVGAEVAGADVAGVEVAGVEVAGGAQAALTTLTRLKTAKTSCSLVLTVLLLRDDSRTRSDLIREGR
jgi:hypothetical protein